MTGVKFSTSPATVTPPSTAAAAVRVSGLRARPWAAAVIVGADSVSPVATAPIVMAVDAVSACSPAGAPFACSR